MTVPPDLNQFIEAAPWRIGLSDAEVERVKQDAFTRGYQAGATVLAHGSPSVHWLGVVAGMLKVDAVSSDGKSTTFAGVSAGAWFGEGAVLKAEPRPYAVVAIRDSTVAFVPRATYMWLIDQSRPFSRWLIEQLNARLLHRLGRNLPLQGGFGEGRVLHLPRCSTRNSSRGRKRGSPFPRTRLPASAGCRARTPTARSMISSSRG